MNYRIKRFSAESDEKKKRREEAKKKQKKAVVGSAAFLGGSIGLSTPPNLRSARIAGKIMDKDIQEKLNINARLEEIQRRGINASPEEVWDFQEKLSKAMERRNESTQKALRKIGKLGAKEAALKMGRNAAIGTAIGAGVGVGINQLKKKKKKKTKNFSESKSFWDYLKNGHRGLREALARGSKNISPKVEKNFGPLPQDLKQYLTVLEEEGLIEKGIAVRQTKLWIFGNVVQIFSLEDVLCQWRDEKVDSSFFGSHKTSAYFPKSDEKRICLMYVVDPDSVHLLLAYYPNEKAYKITVESDKYDLISRATGTLTNAILDTDGTIYKTTDLKKALKRTLL